jgi:hypothetical protein
VSRLGQTVKLNLQVGAVSHSATLDPLKSCSLATLATQKLARQDKKNEYKNTLLNRILLALSLRCTEFLTSRRPCWNLTLWMTQTGYSLAALLGAVKYRMNIIWEPHSPGANFYS